MGLFSSISKAVKSVGTAVKNAGVVVAQSTGVAKLWGDTAKPTVNPSVAKIPVVGGIAKALVEHPYTTAAVVAAPISGAGKKAITTVAKTVVKAAAAKPITSTVAVAVAAPVIAGSVAKDPNKAITTVANAPAAISNFEKNIYTAAKDPTISNILNIAKENPLITAAAVAVPAAAVLKAATIPAVLAANNILDDKTTIEAAPTTTTAPAPIIQTSTTTPAAAVTPVTPQTQPLVATAGSGGSKSSRRRKKPSIKPAAASVRQNLSVIIQNRNQNVSFTRKERIIKRLPLYN